MEGCKGTKESDAHCREKGAMMSLVTTMFLLEKYGPLMDDEDLALILRIKPGTLRNKVSAETLGIKPIKAGQGMLFAVEDVSAYLDALRSEAKAEVRSAA